MKEARIMKENITYYLVWIICLLAGCAPTPKQIEDTTDPIPMYPDYTDIMRCCISRCLLICCKNILYT